MFLVQGDESGDGGSGLLFSLLMLVGLFAVFYFLLIRPQRRRRDQQLALQRSIGVGDEVVTIGGLYGTVAEMDDQTVILETSEGVYSRYARGAIAQKVNPEEAAAADAEPDRAEESGAGEARTTDRADSDPEAVAEPRDTKD